MERDRIADTLRCCILLEEAAAEFYDRLARIVKIHEVSALLDYIARESRNHAQLLRDLHGEPLPTEMCPMLLGSKGASTLSKLRELTAKMDAGWSPSHDRVAELLDELVDMEKLAGEEVYMQIALAVLSSRFTGIERKLLMAIAQEERSHYELVKLAVEELRHARD